ncbi:ArnT family glycosyltransferase [Holophaga foetida]|uniref:ArnT family glycosyltransferase n=1 Tax=Holophaga foetida TaxID=35839 RepID=UPI0002474699|nr:glycosyltransferase family 39 protein [Holophaga foetida]
MPNDAFAMNGPESERRALLLLLLFGLIIFGAGIGLRDPWPADEPRFALVARQMVDSGHWLFPMRGGELYPDKPPMFMWAIACFYKLTGSLRVAFLLPSALASLGTLALVFDLGRRLWDRATAWRAGLLMLLVVQFTLQARTAQIDALVTFFITLGVYALLRFLTEGGWDWFALGWFAAGLGIITKGVGILALFVLIPALWTHRQELKAAGGKAWAKGLVGPLCLLLAMALWVVPMLLVVKASGNPDFLAYRNNILFRQTVTRYGASWHHVAPWYDYIVSVIPGFWLPVSLLLPWLVALPWFKAVREGDRRITLLLGYLVLVLIFFSCSAGKRGVYILPAVPALVLATAPYLPELLERPWPRRLWWGLAGLLTLLAVALPVIFFAKPELTGKLVEAGAQAPTLAASLLALACLAAMITFRRSILAALGTILAALWLFVGFGISPAINEARTPASTMRRMEALTPPGSQVVLVAYKEQFLLFTGRPLNHLPYLMPFPQQALLAAHWQAEGADRWVMGPQRHLSGQFDLSQAQPLGKRHGENWLLLPPGSARPKGTVPEGPIHRFIPYAQN